MAAMPFLAPLRRARGQMRGPVFWLLSGQLIMFVGIAAIFPIAPLYVAHRGGGSVVVALFIAGPLAANTIVQIPAGRFADRVGRRPLLIGSRIAFGLFSIGLFLDVGPLWLLTLFRVAQGLTSGAYVPALRAALTDLSSPENRGQRFAQLQAFEMVGLLLGPLIGGAVALWSDSAVFGVAGLAVFLGVLPMLRVPETRSGVAPSEDKTTFAWWRERGVIIPAIGLAALGTVFSMYDVVWPQYLTARGYGPFLIGVSISLFAVPILALANLAGRLADRVNRRGLVALSFLVVASTAASYPLMRNLVLILLVGTVEAIAVVAIEPTLFAVIGDSAPEHVRGRAMGVGGLFEFSGMAFGAAALGSAYGVLEGLPFWGGSLCLIAAAVVCAAALPAHAPARLRAAPPAERAAREVVFPVREKEVV
jgi:DHA1 family tetracycline resistance protein-like MFS transporter